MTRNDSPSVSRRLITVLFVGQGLALVALFTSTTISSITGVQLAGIERVAGWPLTAHCLAPLGAYIVGRVMNRFGRRIGLSLGYAVGILGGGADLGVIASAFPLFLIGMMLLGAAQAATDQANAGSIIWQKTGLIR